jgi:hypothetical protein
MLNRTGYASVEKFRRVCAIEIPVEVRSLIENFDVVVRRGPPFDESHQWAGMVLQGCAVIVDAVQHDGGDRKNHAGRREFPLCQDAVDQAAMHSALVTRHEAAADLMSTVGKGQVRNIDGRHITAQASFIANLFDVAASLVSLVRRIPLSQAKLCNIAISFIAC